MTTTHDAGSSPTWECSNGYHDRCKGVAHAVSTQAPCTCNCGCADEVPAGRAPRPYVPNRSDEKVVRLAAARASRAVQDQARFGTDPSWYGF